MTETDATVKPLAMPEKFIPYLEKHRLYILFKDMIRDVVINLPKDHLKQMKVFLNRHIHSNKDPDRILILVAPNLKLDIIKLAKELIKGLGLFVITRRSVMDRYEKHDNYVPGCVSPVLLSEVTKTLTLKEPVPQAGWIMFDHPCTVREARCLQQDGVLPTVTLVMMPPPPQAPHAENPLTPQRSFFQQDFEGLKYVYRATVKEVFIDHDDDDEKIATKTINAITACAAGLQGAKQGHHVVGAPGIYRVLLIGPRGAGCRTQATTLSKHFGLVYLNFDDMYNEALERNDELGERLRSFGATVHQKAEVVKRRLLKKDCIDNGWVMTGYPLNGMDFEALDNMTTPPNRVIILNVSMDTCKKRLLSLGVDWCTGRPAAPGPGQRVYYRPKDNAELLDYELDLYFSETLAELRAAAGITAVEVDGELPIDAVQVKIQAAVIAAPAFDIEYCAQLRNVHAE